MTNGSFEVWTLTDVPLHDLKRVFFFSPCRKGCKAYHQTSSWRLLQMLSNMFLSSSYLLSLEILNKVPSSSSHPQWKSLLRNCNEVIFSLLIKFKGNTLLIIISYLFIFSLQQTIKVDSYSSFLHIISWLCRKNGRT